MGKDKKEKRKSEQLDESQTGQDSKELWEEKLKYLNPICKPLASRKQTKKILKVIKKAKEIKDAAAKGIKQVQKEVRRGSKGVVVLAGDVNPIDVYSHMPVACEEADIPYCFVPTKEDIGSAIGTNACIVVLVKRRDDYGDLYDEVHQTLKDMPLPL